MKIAIGNDHSAVELKNIIVDFLKEKGIEVLNLGTDSSESCDYPVYGEKVGRAVVSGEADLGIAICGTGLGISLAANKVKGVRACVCSEPYTAVMSRRHNDVAGDSVPGGAGKDPVRRCMAGSEQDLPVRVLPVLEKRR